MKYKKNYQNEPTFNGVYSKNNLPKIKYGTSIINLQGCKTIRTHWIALHVNGDSVKQFLELNIFQTKLKSAQETTDNKYL